MRLADTTAFTWIKQTVTFNSAVSGVALEGVASTNETDVVSNGYNIRLVAPSGTDAIYQKAGVGEGAFSLPLNGDQMPTDQVEIIIFKDPNIEVDLTQLSLTGGSCNGTSGGNDPVAQFAVVSNNDLTVELDGSGSTDDGAVVAYDWDFGDGSSANGAIVNHTYSQADTYNVQLTVTDDEGNTHQTAQLITVSGASSGNVVIEIANSSGVEDYPVGIFGSGFGSQAGSVTILGESAEILSWTDSFIRAKILNQGEGVGSLQVTTANNEVASWPFEVYIVDSDFHEIEAEFENLFDGKTAVVENLSSNVACFRVGDNASIPASQFLTDYDCSTGYADFDLSNGAATISVDTGQTLDDENTYYFQFFADGSWYKYSEFPDSPFAKTYEIQVAEDGNGPWVTVHSESNNERGSRLHQVAIPDDGNDYRWVRMNVTASTNNDTFRMLEVRFFGQLDDDDKTDSFALFGDSLTAAAFDNPDATYGFEGMLKSKRGTTNDVVFNVFGLVGASAFVNLVEDANSANDIYDALAFDTNDEEMRYWGIALGTNDASLSADYGSRLEPVIIDLLDAERVPIIARLPDTAEALYRPGEFWGDIDSKREILLAIDQLAAEYKLPPGPDLYTAFRLNIETGASSYFDNGVFTPDGVHHTTDGQRKLVELWSDALATFSSSGSGGSTTNNPPPTSGPVIEIANISGVSGYEIGIFGSDFGATQGTVTILNGSASVLEWTDTFVRAVVPSGVDGLGDLRLTRADSADTTSEFHVYTIDSRWLDQPASSYVNVSHGKPTTLTNVDVVASQCYDVDNGSLLDASDYLTDYSCGYGIAAKFKADAAQGQSAEITIDFEQPLADGDYLFQFFSVASWSAGDGCSDQTGFPVAYEVQVSADGATWSSLVTEQANARGNRSHNLSLSGGIQYVQLEVTDAIGDCFAGDGINDFQMKEVRLYQVVGGNNPTDAIAMYGDSITVAAFNAHVGATNLNSRIDNAPSDIPFAPYGFVGRKAQGLNYDGFGNPDTLADVFAGDAIANSAMYWGIALGTNDMNIGDENSTGFTDPNSQFNQFDVHLRTAIEYLRDADRVPIIARLPDTDESAQYSMGFLAAKKILLNEIDRLNAEFGLIPGPDLYTEFRLNVERDNDSWLSDFDGTHLAGDGDNAWIQLWADALSKGFSYRSP